MKEEEEELIKHICCKNQKGGRPMKECPLKTGYWSSYSKVRSKYRALHVNRVKTVQTS